jgi:hypothetical protein
MYFDNTLGLDDVTMRAMLGRLQERACECVECKLPMLYDLAVVWRE